jgi:hypothetical protein
MHTKHSTTIMLLVLAVGATAAYAAEQSWTGSVSEMMCGTNHAKMGKAMDDHDCTIACVKTGVPYALASDGKVYRLSGHESELRSHAGGPVTLTGDMKGNVIHVSRVSPSAP